MAAGLCTDLKSGIEKAADTIDSGAALEKLEQLISFTNK
jgi:anthranilate phosphoribosyltransferase